MQDGQDNPDLVRAISALLNTQGTTRRVQAALRRKSEAWMDRAVVSELRARRVQRAIDAELEDLDAATARGGPVTQVH